MRSRCGLRAVLVPSLLLLLVAGRAPADCTSQASLDLFVTGPGTPGSNLAFTVNFARPDAAVYLVLGATRGETPLGVVTLCVAWPFAVLSMGPVDPQGSARLTFPVPTDLPAGFAVALFAQAAALGPTLLPADSRTTPVVPFAVFSGAPFTVSSVTPSAGGPGTAVTIQGSGFGSDPARVTVRVGDFPIPPVAVSDTQIQLVLPHLSRNGPEPVSVEIDIPRVVGPSLDFQVGPSTSGLVPGWIVLGFPAPGPALSAALEPLVRSRGGRLARINPRLRTALCVVAPGQEGAFLASVPGPSGANVVEQDVYLPLEAAGMGDLGFPDDPQRSNQSHLDQIGGPIVPGPNEPIVALPDSGAPRSPGGGWHPDLAASNLWLPSYLRIDLTTLDPEAIPEDTLGHGSKVIGTIVATPNNTRNVCGLIWPAGQPFRVTPIRLGAVPTGELVADALERAVLIRARVVNISINLPPSDKLRRALNACADAGTVIVKSAGNTGGDVTYVDNATAAGYPDVVIVSGLARGRTPLGELQRWPNSSRTQPGSPVNRQVDLATPAEAIVTLTNADGDNGPGGTNGTSLAAPQVTAAAAIVWSWTRRKPGWTDRDLRDNVVAMLLRGCTRDIGPAGRDDDFGDGSLDLNGRMIFHTAAGLCYSQRLTREPPTDNPEYQRLAHAGTNPRWACDRRAIVYDLFDQVSGQNNVWLQDLDAAGANQGAAVQVATGGQPALEPRGNWIVYVTFNQAAGRYQLRAAPRAGGASVLLYTTNTIVENPVWSRDGTRIIASESGSLVTLPVVRDAAGNVTGAGAPAVVLPSLGTNTYWTPVWSHDGNRIAMTHELSTCCTRRSEIETVPAAGGAATVLTGDGLVDSNGNGTQNLGPAWTPNGARIAFHTVDSQGLPQNPQYRHRVRVVSSTGGAVLTVWDSGWGAQPVPMGLGQFLSLRHSAVDSSRF